MNRLSGGSQHRPASPANPTLPPPIPSYPVFAPPPAAGPGTVDMAVVAGARAGPVAPLDGRQEPGLGRHDESRMEALDEIGEVVFTRDTSNRAPRSMMACTVAADKSEPG